MKKTYEDAKRTLESYISFDEARANAWASVVLNKKKNGEDFAQINKSFTNAKVGEYYPVEDWFNPYLTVHIEYINESGRREYGTDHMEIFSDNNNADESREARKSPYGNYYHYILLPDEIMKKVNERIKMFNESAEEHKTELANLENLYNKYITQVESLMAEMKKEANSFKKEDDIYNSSLYHILKECAESTVAHSY